MRSPLYEQALTKQGVDFTYMERLDLEKGVDVSAGLRNQARLMTPTDEELISQYASLYRQGSQAPPLVVYKKKNRSVWVPIDGNQRIQAAKAAGMKTHDAYVVQTEDPMIIDRVTWVFNNLVNGKRLTREECLEHAKTMVLKHNVDGKTAAKEWGLPYSTLVNQIALDKSKDILRARNVPNVDDIGDKKIEMLQTFLPLGEDIFANAASTVKRCGLSEEDIKELKTQVNRSKTHEEKVQTVLEFGESELAKQRKAETKNGSVRPRQNGLLPSERLMSHARAIQRLLDDYDKVALRRAGVLYKDLQEVIQDITPRLAILFGLGKLPVE